MKKVNFTLILFIFLIITSCDKKNESFPIDKRYWTVEDYKNVVLELKFGIEKDEKLPSLSDPETKIIVEKLIDSQNYEIVLDDKELGLKHKNEVAQGFFDAWKDMTTIYNETDRKDNYLYEIEMIGVYKFGLGLQLYYFKLGNDEIIESEDDPNSEQVQNIINRNVNTLIGNYTAYLNLINEESSFSENGINSYAQGIDDFFPELINNNPNGDYSEMENKITLLEKKCNSQVIKTSLKNIQELIDSKKSKEKVAVQ
jgi:hypothetical protein